MNSEIKIGSTVYGASGASGKVSAISQDCVTIRTETGVRTVPRSAIVRIDPLSDDTLVDLQIGDRVNYVGSDRNLRRLYAGELEVWGITALDGYACLKPDGRVTSWIARCDLQATSARRLDLRADVKADACVAGVPLTQSAATTPIEAHQAADEDLSSQK